MVVLNTVFFITEKWVQNEENMRRKSGLHFGKEKKKVNVPIVKEVVAWTLECVIVLVIAFVFVYFIGLRTSVLGQSMAPTLENRQEIMINRFIYLLSDPKPGDIVVFLPNGNEKSHYYVKRVVGVPGDTLYIKNGILYVNGESIEEYFNDRIAEPGLLADEMTLGEDEYFVIGDNCNNREDSRSANIGTVKKEYIIGKAWFKMASGDSDIGFVE